MVTKFGLTKIELYKIIALLQRYAKVIEKAILFGSRARGDYKNVSDIDIALFFRDNGQQINNIRADLQSENIIYTVDIIDYNKVDNIMLKRAIDSEGILILESNAKGEMMMTKEKLKYKLVDLDRALDRLQQSLLRDAERDDLVVDATIKRFEFTYELAWKLMKAYLEYNGNLDGNSPRRAIQEAFKIGILPSGDGWLEMLEDRNRTTHTYDEQTAKEIYGHVKSNYATLFQNFTDKMRSELAE